MCSEAEAAHQYDAHQGNTERAIAAICRTPVYLGRHTIDGEIRTLAQTEVQAEVSQMLHAAANYLSYAFVLPDCRYIDFYGTL